MLTYELDIERGSLWLRTTPNEFALKQPYFCTEAGIFYARQNFNTIRDYKDSYLLFYTIDGCGLISQNDLTQELRPGEILFINCRTPQSYCTAPQTGRWTHYWAHIDGSGVTALESLLIPDGRNTVLHAKNTILQNRFDTLLTNLEGPSSAEATLRQSVLIHRILTDMILEKTAGQSGNQQLIMKTAEYIRENYARHIDLSELLEIAAMSKAYYLRLFRMYLGTTPYNYILNMRITKAKEYLEVTDKTVHEIALETGFSDDSSFSTRFTSIVGTSPLKYRKSAITRNQSSV